MGVCCSKRMKKRRLATSDMSSAFSESDSRDESSQNSSDSRKNRTSFSRQSSSRKKANNKPSTKGRTSSSAATTGTTNDKGRPSSPSTKRPAAAGAPVKVNLPRFQLSKIQANPPPVISAMGTQSTITSKYYLPGK